MMNERGQSDRSTGEAAEQGRGTGRGGGGGEGARAKGNSGESDTLRTRAGQAC